MARVWMEGFEDGLPNANYLTGVPTGVINDLSLYYPYKTKLISGRNTYSNYGIEFDLGTYAQKSVNLSELYFRAYYAYTSSQDSYEIIHMYDGSGNKLIAIYSNGSGSFSVKVRVGGVWTTYDSFLMSVNTWYKIDIYFKVNGSTGTYEVKINNVSVSSRINLNTGTSNVVAIRFGTSYGSLSNPAKFDDIALNDTTGTSNNSWCGNGTIVNLKPKANGNSNDFAGYGWTTCNAGTTATNITISNHGLSDGDVIYNVTRNAYRTVTVVDIDNVTVSSVTNQTEGDVFVTYKYVSTIAAGTGTTTSKVVLSGHTLESYDVIVNTTRSNAIRRVIYVSGTSVYNFYEAYEGYLGSEVSSQVSGDVIKTYKVNFTTLDNYKCCNQSLPNPAYAHIESSTSNHKNTFDMQELVADKSIPNNAVIVALSHNIYAKEAGAGSQIKPVFRIGTTDYEGSTIPLVGGTLQYQTVYNSSPATSTSFTLSEVDSLEAGVKVV
jgi:hypothetical protein